jgi:hypothetical protein
MFEKVELRVAVEVCDCKDVDLKRMPGQKYE